MLDDRSRVRVNWCSMSKDWGTVCKDRGSLGDNRGVVGRSMCSLIMSDDTL